MGSGAGEWHLWGSQELCWELHPRAELAVGWAVHALPRAGARAARAFLGKRGSGTSRRETQPGLVSECLILGCVWGTVLWWWPRRSAGWNGNYGAFGVSLCFWNVSPSLKNCKCYTQIIPVAEKFLPVQATTFGVNTGLIKFSFMLYWHLILCQDRIPNALKTL